MSQTQTPLTAVIVDDESHCVKTLAWELEGYAPGCQLLKSFTDSNEALRELPRLNPDVLFLDIEMPMLNGFDLLNQLTPKPRNLIFTTAYSEYAVRAFEYSAIDYLLKPVDKDDLASALDQIAERPAADPEQDSYKLRLLFDNLSASEQGRPMRLSLPTGEGWELVSIGDIVRCASDGSYTEVILTDGQKLTISRNLKQLEDTLTEQGFYRVHNSHLVNFSHVKRFVRQDGGSLIMSDGSEVSVSRSKKEMVLNMIR